MAVVAERIADGAVLALIKQWLKAPVVEPGEEGRRGHGGGKGNRRGTPQGGVISPLLANLYLHLLDRIWERRRLADRLQARLVRYADDLVVLCAGDVAPAMAVLRRVLDRLDLSLNEAKTRVVDAREDKFDFLGFTYRLRRSRRSGKLYPHVEPSKRAVARIKVRLSELTHRRRTPVPLPVVVEQMNQALRGWASYFHHRNCSRIFGRVKWHAEERLRTHLRKRHKVRARKSGYKHFPSHDLYRRHGLYKIPTTAGWTKAHALR
jgi:group II intron reverse transcriptase/maturase